MARIDKLLAISSEALGASPDCSSKCFEDYFRGEDLFRMLKQKNGFYAFEYALHVFPIGSDVTGTMILEDWNSSTLWRTAYHGMADGLFCFAEDVFGDQFCLSKTQNLVLRFAAETGQVTEMAEGIEEWAGRILSSYEIETGWPLAHEWQHVNGSLPLGCRLQPSIPFILGGEYSLDNVWAGDAVEGMLFKGELAVKIKDLPDGTTVKLRVGRPGE